MAFPLIQTGGGASGTLPSTITKVSHQWLDSYSAITGLFTQSQPAASDISGLATLATTGAWSDLQNATASLTLANGANATTFNQTSAVNWTWANTTAATASVSQSSPILNINGTYWNGSASATDSWTIQDVVANGTNGTSTLTFGHAGTSGRAIVSLGGMFLLLPSGPNSPGNVAAGFAGTNGLTNGAVSLYTSNGSAAILQLLNGGSISFNFTSTGFTIGPRITSYNGIATVSNGVASEVATVDSTGLVASTGTVTLYAVPAAGAGQYRVSWNAKITTAGTSPVIGPLTLTYTDPDGTVCAMVVPSSNSAGTTSASGNSANSTTATGVMLGCAVLLNCKASTNIQYSFPVSGTVGTGAWNLHIKCEAM